ncbi:MAG: MBOAT family O-acyltransferase [Gammaproteobacteria bacterium]
MLFNSYEFIFVFLPITLVCFYQLGKRGYVNAATVWLVAASLFFYGWWNPAYLALIVGSIMFNYTAGRVLSARRRRQAAGKSVLIVAIAANLGVLAYFKYANFFVENLAWLRNTDYNLVSIVLPLAISFFTFQQITYLVDAYRGRAGEHSFLRYCLFVTFFPQLIAGPIVHHSEMLPQFAQRSTYRLNDEHIAVGLTIFFIGLFKKVVIADGVALYATPVFDAAARGEVLTFFEAWTGALAYTFQLYFDFSGYSDMAVGLARMFGIQLPLNFFSPYKAVNIIEFWRRWHLTLSRFLRDYLYIPLGGGRRGVTRRYLNLVITMLLGGLWHGASWTFVAWGGLHGFYLVTNHAWRRYGFSSTTSSWWGRATACLITFLAVVVGWVFFRAESFAAASSILQAMAGANGFILPPAYFDYLNKLAPLGYWLQAVGWRFENAVPYFGGAEQLALFAFSFVVVWGLPNTHQLMGRYAPGLDIYERKEQQGLISLPQWQPVPWIAVCVVTAAVWSVFSMDRISEFLYYQF